MSRIVGRATVLAGLKSFKNQSLPNVSDTYRGQILLESGEVRTAIIKDVPAKELANEILAAALGYQLELPIPDAFLVTATTSTLAAMHAPKANGLSLLFASADVSSPPMSHFVVGALPERAIRRLLDAFVAGTPFGRLYGFDAWIANIDRNLGNLLFAGNSEPWYIDHGRGFTGDTWRPADLEHEKTYRNRLKEWATPFLTFDERKKCAREANELISKLALIDVAQVGRNNALPALLGHGEFEALTNFLTRRVQHANRLASDALDIKLIA